VLHKSDSETKLISLTIMNLATPKAGAKPEFLFNKMASGILGKFRNHSKSGALP
jgi:hypothetical protein